MAPSNKKKTAPGSISKYLVHKEAPQILIQARVDAELGKKLREKLKRENFQISEWMEAAVKAYLEES